MKKFNSNYLNNQTYFILVSQKRFLHKWWHHHVVKIIIELQIKVLQSSALKLMQRFVLIRDVWKKREGNSHQTVQSLNHETSRRKISENLGQFEQFQFFVWKINLSEDLEVNFLPVAVIFAQIFKVWRL